MPRSNRQSLSTRLASIPRVNLSDREPHQIVGTTEWAEVKQRVAFLEGRTKGEQISGLCRNELWRKNPAYSRKPETPGCSPQLVDKILQFISSSGWAQIEGGEHDGRWVNPKHYPNRIFETGRVKEDGTGETHYFPLSGTEEDEKGLALHYEVYNGGAACTVAPNIWRRYTTYAQRRRESREARRKEREIDNLAQETMMNAD